MPLTQFRLSPFLLAAIALASFPAAAAGEVEQNKAIARKLFDETLNKDRWDTYLAIHAPAFRAHAGRSIATREEDLEFAKGWRRAFPDGAYTIEKLVAEGDLVAVYWTGRGTNTGEGNGLPATGKAIDVTGVTLLKIVDGQILEEWNVTDQLTMYRQLGLSSPQKKPPNP